MAPADPVLMPLIHIHTSVAAPAGAPALLADVSRELASLLGKPERYVMTLLDGAVPMTFGGDTSPCAYVEIRSIGALDGERPRRITASLSDLLKRHLSVPADRIYVGFEDVPARLWGWNGGTFG
jgi:phenylpyruvate tautomerase